MSHPTLFDAATCDRCAAAAALVDRTEDTNIANARRALEQFWPVLKAVETDTRHGPDLSPMGRLVASAGVVASYLGTALEAHRHLSEDMARLMIDRHGGGEQS